MSKVSVHQYLPDPLETDVLGQKVDEIAHTFYLNNQMHPEYITIGMDCIKRLSKSVSLGDEFPYCIGVSSHMVLIRYVQGKEMAAYSYEPEKPGTLHVKPIWGIDELWENEDGKMVVVKVATNRDMMAYRRYGSQDPTDWTFREKDYLRPFGFAPAFESIRARGNG
jgi:hypothetical protein